LHAGEEGDGEKVEGVVVLVRNEEKGESSEGKATSQLISYQSTLRFFFHFFFTWVPLYNDKTATAMHFCTVYAWHEIPDFSSGIL